MGVARFIWTKDQFSHINFRLKIGDMVELVNNYERFGDATNGPLLPGDRGTVIELQGKQGLR